MLAKANRSNTPVSASEVRNALTKHATSAASQEQFSRNYGTKSLKHILTATTTQENSAYYEKAVKVTSKDLKSLAVRNQTISASFVAQNREEFLKHISGLQESKSVEKLPSLTQE